MRRLAAVLLPCFLVLASCATTPPPEPVDQEIENLRAFAKLYGYIRWFHPSDEAASIDWNKFAVHGAERVVQAKDSFELVEILDELFDPLAPTMTLSVGRTDIGAPPYPECDGADEVTAWQHSGVYLGPGSNVYRSARARWPTNEAALRHDSTAAFARLIPASAYRGKEFRINASLRSAGEAQLWLRIDREDNAPPLQSASPAASAQWTPAELSAEVPDDAMQIVYGIWMDGATSASLTQPRVAIKDERGWVEIPRLSTDLERGVYGDLPRGWMFGTHAHDLELSRAPDDGGAVATVTLSDERYPMPGDRFTRQIGTGIEASFPTALYVTNDRTCPRPDPSALRALNDALATIDTDETGAHRAIRDAGVVAGWAVMQHFYPYFDEVEVDWDAELTLALKRSRADTDGDGHLASLRQLLEALDDSHGTALHPDMLKDRNPQFSVDRIEGRIVVVATTHDEIQEGDIVVTLDGEPADRVISHLEDAIPGSPQHKRARALGEFGRGPGDVDVHVVLRRDGQEFEVTSVRDQRQPLEENRPDAIAEIEPGIWYVDVSRALIQGSLNELAAADGIVFDIRGYPRDYSARVLGHLTDEYLDSAQWHKPSAVLPDQERVEYTVNSWQVEPRTPRFTGTPVFLTGGGAISAAETWMGIIEHYQLGEIVGQTTAGVNGNINMIDLPGGYRLVFTGFKTRKHDGSPHHVVGVSPTVPVERTLAAVREGRDEYIEKAVEIIRAEAGAMR